ncbi:MAG: hypothetical protein IJK56_01780 [Firmicutes bacterium]|nr:hypothetical protein [Bacillota bacterium]
MRKRKFLALLMAIAMFISVVPASAYAEEVSDVSGPEVVLENSHLPNEDETQTGNDESSVPAEAEDLPVEESSVVEEEVQEDSISEESEDSEPFEQSVEVNDVIVTVKAAEGIFPNDATLHVEAVNTEAAENAEAAAENLASANKAVSFTFDIKVLDANGQEIQPNTEKGEVTVTFAMAAPIHYDDVEVYHVENKSGTEVTPLDTTVEENGEQIEATATTEGFSLFVVQFIYNGIEYDLLGYEKTKLSNIQEALGLTGEIESAASSAPELFSIEEIDGVLFVVSHLSFSTAETLTLVIDGATYVIDVLDPPGSRYRLRENQISFNTSTGIELDPVVVADDRHWIGGTVWGITTHELEDTSTGQTVIFGYCLEPNATTTDGNTYQAAFGYAQDYWEKLENSAPEMKTQISRAIWLADSMIANGYKSYPSADISGTAQVIVYEILCGYRDASTGIRSSAYIYNKIDIGNTARFQDIYEELDRQLVHYEDRTSFASITAADAVSASRIIKLDYNATNKNWSKTLTDSSGVWADFLSAPSGSIPGTDVSYTRSGNSITFTASTVFSGTAASGAIKKQTTGSDAEADFSIYGDTSAVRSSGEGQIIAGEATADPVNQYLAFELDTVPMKVMLKKTSSNTSSYYVDNPMYTLKDAVYGVYSSRADASSDTDRLDILKTDEDGNAVSTKSFNVGDKIYVKEVTAPKGYALDTAIYELTVSTIAADNVISVTDVPVADPVGVLLVKVDAKTGEDVRRV